MKALNSEIYKDYAEMVKYNETIENILYLIFNDNKKLAEEVRSLKKKVAELQTINIDDGK